MTLAGPKLSFPICPAYHNITFPTHIRYLAEDRVEFNANLTLSDNPTDFLHACMKSRTKFLSSVNSININNCCIHMLIIHSKSD